MNGRERAINGAMITGNLNARKQPIDRVRPAELKTTLGYELMLAAR